MVTLYRTDGTIEVVSPANGNEFSLAELQALVGGLIQVVQTHDGRVLICDEEGKLKGKAYNPLATLLYKHGSGDPIVGDAVVGPYREIFSEENDEDDESPTVEPEKSADDKLIAQMLVALHLQHKALDSLMAYRIWHEKTYLPTQDAPTWLALVTGNAAIKAAEARK